MRGGKRGSRFKRLNYRNRNANRLSSLARYCTRDRNTEQSHRVVGSRPIEFEIQVSVGRPTLDRANYISHSSQHPIRKYPGADMNISKN